MQSVSPSLATPGALAKPIASPGVLAKPSAAVHAQFTARAAAAAYTTAATQSLAYTGTTGGILRRPSGAAPTPASQTATLSRPSSKERALAPTASSRQSSRDPVPVSSAGAARLQASTGSKEPVIASTGGAPRRPTSKERSNHYGNRVESATLPIFDMVSTGTRKGTIDMVNSARPIDRNDFGASTNTAGVETLGTTAGVTTQSQPSPSEMFAAFALPPPTSTTVGSSLVPAVDAKAATPARGGPGTSHSTPQLDNPHWKHGAGCRDGWVTLGNGEKRFVQEWQPNSEGCWSELFDTLGTVREKTDALRLFGCFTRGRALCLVSTSSAKEWVSAVRRQMEVTGKPTFNPNGAESGEDQEFNGDWLQVFVWCVKAAAISGGCMVLFYLPGSDLSPMQRAEQMIAEDNALRIERRVLDVGEAQEFGITVSDDSWLSGSSNGSAVVGHVLRSLVAELSAGDAADKERAAYEIGSRADNAERAVAIREAGGIMPLATLLRDGSTPQQKEHAAFALARLAKNAENKVIIREAGCIPHLVALVVQRQNQYAAAALANLAANNKENMIEIREAGAIPALVAFAKNGATQKPNKYAAAALKNLAADANNKAAIKEAGGTC